MYGSDYRTVNAITVIINYRSLLLNGFDYNISKLTEFLVFGGLSQAIS